MRPILDRTTAHRSRAFLVVGAVALALAATACNDILKVELPGRIPVGLLNDPTAAPTLAASVVADFECAFSTYVNSTSTISDQFLGASGSLQAENWGTKKISENDATNERYQCGQGYGGYTPLQIARFQADDISTRLDGWTDVEAEVRLAPLRANVAAYGAYAYTLLGEGFCAMRFNEAHQILTPPEVLAIAEAKFDSALALVDDLSDPSDAALKSDLENLVHLGRARVRLDLGNGSGAAADAALVTPGWEFFVTRGDDGAKRNNDPYVQMTLTANSSVAPQYRNLTVGGVPDPRVVVAFGPDVGYAAVAFDGITPLYVVTNKNFSRSAHMRLASYIEAQLIQAEVAGGATAIGIINARHADLGLPAYAGASDPASVQALVLDERNREFFMEGGQRFNDLLRFHIPWKVGNDQNGVAYGLTTCLPLPLNERLAAGG